jgi:hypothetical protein
MSQSKLRVLIFALWILFWLVSTALVLFASSFPQIDRRDVMPALLSITGIWIPPLSCLASFWFPEQERLKATTKKVTGERAFAALVLSVTYLTFVLIIIAWQGFVYNSPSSFDEKSGSFLEQIGDAVRLSLVVSPIALAPINWLTGGRSDAALKPARVGSAADHPDPIHH